MKDAEHLTLHVAAGGDDTAPGTEKAPFATVERARDAVAELLRAGPPRPVTVSIHAGVYHLSGTLELDGAVSGTADHPVVFAAAPGERVVLSGGRPVTGWRREEGAGDLWVAPAPAGGVFRTLRVGDRLAERARYPSADAGDRIRGGWLFADWWRHPWERGRFEQPISRVRRAGDYLQWRVRVPAAGTYTVWISYVKDESTTHPAVASVFGARGGERVKLADLAVTPDWRAGTHEAFPYVAAGELRLQEGEQDLYWENVSGGQIDFDAAVLCSDPDWDPAERIRLTIWHPRAYEVDPPAPGAEYLVLQAEAFSSASPGVGIADVEPSGAPRAEPGGRPGLVTMAPDDVPGWTDWEGAEIDVFSAWGWNNLIQPVERYDAASRTIHFESYNDVRPGNRYFITGVRGALTDPGEWHLDAADGTIRYLAPAGVERIDGAVAGVLKTAVRISGSHVELRDLVIADTDYAVAPDRQAQDGAIELDRAEYCAVVGCRFECVNGWGVRMVNRSHHNRVERCTMHDLGQGGVELFGDDYSQPFQNEIIANDIAGCGRVYAHVAGVYGNASSRNRIAYNRIRRMPRYAISLKSGGGHSAHQNVIEYNDIADLNLATSDTGAVEIYGGDRKPTGNVVRYNRIVNSVGLKVDDRGRFVTPVYSWGIYLDDWCSGVTIHGNIIVGNVVGGVNMHGGWGNLVENNILVDGQRRQLSLAPIFSDLQSRTLRDNVFRRNVVAWSERTSAMIWCRPRRWYPEILRECDHNVYHFRGGSLDLESPEIDITPLGSLPRWRDAGFDRHSVIADPLFTDPAAGDFTLRADSPAFGIGFRPIPVDRIGPEGYAKE